MQCPLSTTVALSFEIKQLREGAGEFGPLIPLAGFARAPHLADRHWLA
jgi:hypothetical protein